jgi:hypothetical protein
LYHTSIGSAPQADGLTVCQWRVFVADMVDGIPLDALAGELARGVTASWKVISGDG